MNHSFEDYIAWAEPYIDMSLREQQKQFESVLKPLHRVALVQSYLNDTRQTPRPREPRALYVIGALATQIAMGIHASISVGAVFPVAINFRTLFELLLSVKLIREKDTQARSDLYMDFDKVLRWDNVNKKLDAGLPVDAPYDTARIQSEYDAVANRFASNPTYWWSSIMWISPNDLKKRNSIGPAGVCSYLDNAGVSSGMGNGKFKELRISWYSAFSALTHGSVIAANALSIKGRRVMGWQLSPMNIGIAVLATTACGEIISECEDGLNHPKARWTRMYLTDLVEEVTKAQVGLMKASGV